MLQLLSCRLSLTVPISDSAAGPSVDTSVEAFDQTANCLGVFHIAKDPQDQWQYHDTRV